PPKMPDPERSMPQTWICADAESGKHRREARYVTSPEAQTFKSIARFGFGMCSPSVIGAADCVIGRAGGEIWVATRRHSCAILGTVRTDYRRGGTYSKL